MRAEERYIEVNKRLWNEKTKYHIQSAFYNNTAFLAGESTLKEPELAILGNVAGKEILHLQCHFGQDTMSLARMGAKCTGADLSDEAIRKATEFNAQLRLDAKFVCADVYNLPNVLTGQFDIVFTSYGVLGWLPDMQRWAKVVAHFLKQGGKLVLVEMHPVVWMFDNEFTYVQYPYFNKEAIIETLKGTYADRDADMEMEEIGWNHPLSDVLQSLIDAGLQINLFNEYDYCPYDCFANTVEVAKGKFNIKGMEGKLPMLYAVVAEKR
ncbi:SAM-dependent methyltransferase [Chitinophagaceae bacterium IBVUCB1]|nr:SAM-dependent methyltransferase [Chitinophagaceae bacterium IBVUCB1]